MANLIRVLHLDDDLTILDRVAGFLQTTEIHQSKVELTAVSDIPEFRKALSKPKSRFEVILIDIHLGDPDITGVELAAEARQEHAHAAIVMMSSTRDAKTIGYCLKAGADDFVDKAVTREDLITRIEAALEGRTAARRIADLKTASPSKSHETACGQTMQAIVARVPAIIASAINCVYIEGESGTGKEVIADFFSNLLPSSVPFIRVNCGAIAPSLIASELFGHVKGAFTGALADKIGLIESANGGWIFLDELASLPSDAQVSLLRAIDNQVIRRVGGSNEKSVSFRIISATNEPLKSLVEKGLFRRDLWQRLRETEITLPPLRDRKREIPDLVSFFIRTMRGGPYKLAPTVLDTLMAYDWREGNVRELRNALRAMTEKAVVSVLTPKSIPERIWQAIGIDTKAENHPARETGSTSSLPYDSHRCVISWDADRPNLEQLERQLLLALIKIDFQEQGHLSFRTLSKTLGIAKSTVATRIRDLVSHGLIAQHDLNEMLKNGAGGAD
jgi:DNA-binding NtrC family response regulator